MTRVEHLSDDVTLYLGDCLDILPGLTADHVISDPPYEATLHAAKNSLTGRKHRNDGVAELKGLDFAPIDGIRARVVSLVEAACNGWFIAFCTAEGVARWADEINASALKYKRACVWVKPDSTPQLNGQGPAMGAEMFVCSWGGTGFARWNAGGKRGVYTHCVNTGRQGEHPTEKPVPLMVEIVSDFTQPGETICDPFAGSGTTGVACVRTGRGFVGIERDPKWFDLACRRISDELRRPRLQLEPVAKPVQEVMF